MSLARQQICHPTIPIEQRLQWNKVSPTRDQHAGVTTFLTLSCTLASLLISNESQDAQQGTLAKCTLYGHCQTTTAPAKQIVRIGSDIPVALQIDQVALGNKLDVKIGYDGE
jgi:hypothetical protein